MVVPHKTADSQRKGGFFSAIANVLSGRNESLQSLDLEDIDLDALRRLVMENRGDENLLVHYARRAMVENRIDDVLDAVTADPETILEHCPSVAAQYLVIHRGSHEVFSADQLFRLGQWCESAGKASFALSIYEQWELAYFEHLDLEVVSYRAACLWWREMANARRALQKLEIIHRKFRHGQYAQHAGLLRDEILGVSQDRNAA